MKLMTTCIVLVLLTIVAMLCVKKIVECLLNILIFNKKENRYNVAKQRNGIVYNKKTQKLEADQSIILPFE